MVGEGDNLTQAIKQKLKSSFKETCWNKYVSECRQFHIEGGITRGREKKKTTTKDSLAAKLIIQSHGTSKFQDSKHLQNSEVKFWNADKMLLLVKYDLVKISTANILGRVPPQINVNNPPSRPVIIPQWWRRYLSQPFTSLLLLVNNIHRGS